MRLHLCILTAMTALVVPAAAQEAAGPEDAAACAAKIASITQDVDSARTKGQMLRRQQLASELAALRARCEPHKPAMEPDRADSIQKLEQEIQALRAQLARAEEQLRKLKNDAL